MYTTLLYILLLWTHFTILNTDLHGYFAVHLVQTASTSVQNMLPLAILSQTTLFINCMNLIYQGATAMKTMHHNSYIQCPQHLGTVFSNDKL